MLPNLTKDFGLSKAQWKDLETKYSERMTECEMEIERAGASERPTVLLDLVLLASADPKSVARALLQYTDDLAAAVARMAPPNHVAGLRDQIRPIFTDFSDRESGFRNKLAELAAIEYVLRVSQWTLAGVEVRISPNTNKRLDLLVRHPKGEEVPIEIMSVFLEPAKLTDVASVEAFLNGRIEAKIADKLKTRLSAHQLPFPLLLCLWIEELDELRRLAPMLITARANQNVLLCAFLQVADTSGKRTWIFDSVAAIESRVLP